MDKKKVVITIDIGTQSLRASFVDTKGKILYCARQKYEEPYFSPKPSYCEQNPSFYFDEMCLATKELMNSEIAKEVEPTCIVICTFRDTAVFLDENYNVIRPSILWLDPRNASLKNDYNLKFYEKLIFKMVGMYDAVRYNAKRTPSWWIKENEPETWKKIKHYAPLGAYINYRLTNNLVVSNADCIGHYPINFKKGKWFGKKHIKQDVFGIDLDMLPPLINVGEVIGVIDDKASELTGLPKGIKLYASGSDKSCEVLGNGCLNMKNATVSFGTACSIDLVVDKYKDSEPFLPAYRAPINGLYNMEIQIYRGFWMLNWFIKNFASDQDIKSADLLGLNIESFLDKEIEKIEPGASGLVIQPYWGAGLSRPNARGLIIGFSDCHNKYHIYRATIEGICFALKEGLMTLQKRSHKKVKGLVISGGGARNDVILQIASDIFNLPVYKTESVESATIGAAIAGFVYSNVYSSSQEAVENMVRYVKNYTPNPENVKKYDYLYKKVYTKLYKKSGKLEYELKQFSIDSEVK